MAVGTTAHSCISRGTRGGGSAVNWVPEPVNGMGVKKLRRIQCTGAADANRRRRPQGRGRSAAPGLARANHLGPHHPPTLYPPAYHTSPQGERISRGGKRAKWGE